MAVYIDNVPEGEKISDDFTITVNGLGLRVHEARVSAVPFNRRWPGHQRSVDQSELAYFASFSMISPAEVRIIPKKPFQSVAVKPFSKNIKPEIERDAIIFTVEDAGGYSIEFDGFHNALHLFVNPAETYEVDLSDENTLYFGPGVHEAGLIHLKSGQTVYLDSGSVVYACIHAEGVDNIRVMGQGILDNSKNKEEILFEVEKTGSGDVDVRNSKREHTIQLKNVKNVEIDGITIRDSLLYNIAAFGCENLTVNNIKIIGCWRYNSDGIDLHNCSHCVIRNCFVRTYDDSICIKGHMGYPQVCGDILVENCVIWCDWGRSMEIGAETCAEKIHNITFRNCDIIRSSHVALDIQNVDYGDVYDIAFEGIRVEYDPVSQRPSIQENDEERYAFELDSDYMPQLIVSQVYKHHEYSECRERRGKNHDITFSGIHVIARRMPPSSLSGFDHEHRTSDIKIKDLFLNGRKLMALGEANIELGSFVDSITLE